MSNNLRVASVVSAKILVVDDNVDGLELLSVVLSQEGFTVFTAEDGLTAYQLAQAILPQLIITDLRMPGMSGIELIKRLRQHPEVGSVPIVALTANTEVVGEAAEAGADRVVTKPVMLDDLLNTIKPLLSLTGLLVAALRVVQHLGLIYEQLDQLAHFCYLLV